MRGGFPKTIALISLLSVGLAPFGHTMEVIVANVFKADGFLVLNSKAELRLSKAVIEALESNISIILDFEVEIRGKRFLFWRERSFSKKYRFRLQKYALNEGYIVTEERTGQKISFQDLDKALNHLGNRHQMRLFKLKSTADLNFKEIAIRWELVTAELPTPMALTTLFSPDWSLNSPWYKKDLIF